MFIYNSLPAPPPPVVCQPPCQSKHTGPLQTDPEHDFRKERTLFPSFSPFSCPNSPTQPSLPLPLSQCVFQRVTLGKTEQRQKGEERKGEGGGWIEEKEEGAEVYSIQHGLLNWFQSSSWTPGMHGTHCRRAVFAFVGCRKSDIPPCSQPTSLPSLPPRMKRARRMVALKQVSSIL